jgi:hypothetical protein
MSNRKEALTPQLKLGACAPSRRGIGPDGIGFLLHCEFANVTRIN